MDKNVKHILQPQSISISVSKLERGLRCEAEYHLSVLYNELENGFCSCYIPALDIYYTADNVEEVVVLAKSLTNSFGKHWTINNNFIRFIQHLRVLGFNPTHDIWHNIIKKKDFMKETKFSKSLFKIPTEFKKAKGASVTGKLTEVPAF